MSKTAARAYESPLRKEQALQTRERVLDAAVEELAEASGELTVPAVAKRARVSLRTVYRHFPTKQAVVDGVADRYQRRFGAPYLGSLEDLPAATERMVRSFRDDEQLARAVLRIDPAALAPERSVRLAALEETLAPVLRGRPPGERRQIVGVMYAVHGLLMWQTLRSYVGLGEADAAAAVGWVTRTLVEALQEQAERPVPLGITSTRREGTA
jgi:AcrR family transcriptional regulator